MMYSPTQVSLRLKWDRPFPPLFLYRADLGTRLLRRFRNFLQFRPCLSYWLTGALNSKQVMIIGSRQQLEKVSVAELSVGDISVAPASTARNLGVLFDWYLKFDAQITQTCTGYYYLHNIRKIRKYLTLDSTRCSVHALVMGGVDYCNSLIYGLPRNISLLKIRRHSRPQSHSA